MKKIKIEARTKTAPTNILYVRGVSKEVQKKFRALAAEKNLTAGEMFEALIKMLE